MLQNLFNYWYDLEFFSPCWPVAPSRDIDLAGHPLPWPRPADQAVRYSYDIYLGKAKACRLVSKLMDTLGMRAEDRAPEYDNALVCLCALKVDQAGQYVAGSFGLSSFAWAISCLMAAHRLDARLDPSALEKLQARTDEQLCEAYALPGKPPFCKADLIRLYRTLLRQLGFAPEVFFEALWARPKKQHANKDGSFPPLDPSTELVQSFYLRDLARIRQAPGPLVEQYALALQSPCPTRIQIDCDVQQMQRWLDAAAFPLGLWPAAHNPCLMQQLAVNLAIAPDAPPLFSVNGPPGTGKTTLLKEIVASNVVQRAIHMASYDKPDDAFTAEKFQTPPDPYTQNFYRPDPALTAYGILVASNNNAAVENISVGLPESISKDRTGRFSGADAANPGPTYFADLASALLGKPAWGLISARLGKRKNIADLRERLWWAGDGLTLKAYYEQELPDWQAARQAFRSALDAVQQARQGLVQAQADLRAQRDAVHRQAAARAALQQAQDAQAAAQRAWEAGNQAQQSLKRTLAAQNGAAALLKNQLSFIKRTFPKKFAKDPLVAGWLEAQQTADQTALQLKDCARTLPALEQALAQARARTDQAAQERAQADTARAQAGRALAVHRETLGSQLPGPAFWQDITSNQEAQTACPWTYAAYDRLREELFYQALMLHKAFVLSSNRVKQNLMRLFALWGGRLEPTDRKAAYGDLLNTLLLIIPVLSTTFASVQTFLEDVPPGALGLVIIDEAGQATPQSALGALWRTRRAVIVGDPLQVEPIVTVPKELIRRFAAEHAIPPAYQQAELSVQILADQCNPFGGLRQIGGEPVWLGCPLVVHRRCMDPMFRIANQVAYNGRMFSKTVPPDPARAFLLPRSVWFDIRGAEHGDRNHTVDAQIQAAAQLFVRALAVYHGLPDLYLITPFTSVEQSLRETLDALLQAHLPAMSRRDISGWLDTHCGTIHTFQGREASEVLLILGCDANSGKSAALWVGQKPNMINVAVSRAKYRLGVIGDLDLWRHVPYVQTVCRTLPAQGQIFDAVD